MPGKSKKEEEGPKKKTLYTIKLTLEQMERLEDILEEREWEFYNVDFSRFGYKGEQVNVVGYQSGKLVVQGKNTEEFVTDILEAEVTGDPLLGYEEVHHEDWFEPHAGVDESGKGDLFGPLVSATVIADGDMVRQWREAGIQDSKRITDPRILKLDRVIRNTKGAVVETALCGMERYNELMSRPRANLNQLLAWLHGKTINAALDKRFVERGLLDQFSKKPLTQQYVKDRKGFTLEMRVRAEEDPVVAAASVVARAEYVRQCKKLEDVAGEPLLKGASAEVKKQAIRIFEKGGVELLGKLAKLHFRTAYEAQGLEPPKAKFVYRGSKGG